MRTGVTQGVGGRDDDGMEKKEQRLAGKSREHARKWSNCLFVRLSALFAPSNHTIIYLYTSGTLDVHLSIRLRETLPSCQRITNGSSEK